ncbi:RNA polymerase sigma factor [Actinomadura atramentaria]|uniref:RNA polymerase sigma factor n=1 Tax=Actinomadura atramentaria TaxID=1990 RepID=UPI00037ACBDD|nr:sigma-70 family RNA polymerase sigma factor [Actinomadura atramentaria]
MGERVGDGELLLRARDGDAAAWDALVGRYGGLLWTIARACRLGDADCADVVQITWLRLVERLDALRDPDAVGAWLAVTARREARRTAHRRGLAPLCAGAGADPYAVPGAVGRGAAAAPDELAAARDRVAEVGAALRGLPRRCQDVLRLAVLAPGQAELAAALERPVGSVGPLRARCVAELRRRLGR